jgi:multiple sugar transport system substrate-binding protein
MHPINKRRPAVGLVATALTAALALSACSSSGSTSPATATPTTATPTTVTQAAIDAAMTTETNLTFWTWVPDITDEVALFEKAYPAIHVDVVNVGQGAAHYQKLRTAIKAGSGGPDVVQVEFQYLPSFTQGGDLLDLAPYGAASIKSDYAGWVWSQVSNGDAVYGIPQDIGPMGNLYRNDLLSAAGITPPTTWEEFAKAARDYQAANPDKYLTNMPGNDAGQFMGLLWQAGARPFGYDGKKTVTINFDTPEVAKVIDLWNPLVKDGVIGVDPDFTDQWYQGLANGQYASWQGAAWGPVFLQGTAEKTSGLWTASPLPQWDASKPAAGNWGGSTDAVLKSTKNPIAAAQLALWINTQHDSALMLATKQFLFPASNTILNDPAFVDDKSAFYGGQQVNKEFAAISATVTPDFEWLPFMDYAYSSFDETLGKAFADRTDLATGLTAWQTALTTYATQQGFTVKK